MSAHRNHRLHASSKSRFSESHTGSRADAATSTTDQCSHLHTPSIDKHGDPIQKLLKVSPMLTISLATDAFRELRSSRSLGTLTELVGCSAFEAEELQVDGNQLEQHVAADLNRAALVLGCLQERGDVGVEHYISDV